MRSVFEPFYAINEHLDANSYFVADDNALVMKRFHYEVMMNPSGKLWIKGPAKCGKTHLWYYMRQQYANRHCWFVKDNNLNLPLTLTSAIERNEQPELIVIDSIESFTNEELFGLFERTHHQHIGLIILGEVVIQERLDLDSRLKLFDVVEYPSIPSESFLELFIVKLLNDYGIKSSPNVVSYLVSALPRNTYEVYYKIQFLVKNLLENNKKFTDIRYVRTII